MIPLDYALKLLSENVGIIVALIAAYAAFKINDHKKIQDKKIEIYDELARDLGEISEISLRIHRSIKRHRTDEPNVEKMNQTELFEEKFEQLRIKRTRYQLYMNSIPYKSLHQLISSIEFLQTKRKNNSARHVGKEKSNIVQEKIFDDIFKVTSLYLLRNKKLIEKDVKNSKLIKERSRLKAKRIMTMIKAKKTMLCPKCLSTIKKCSSYVRNFFS